jgi:hypothetical protein
MAEPPGTLQTACCHPRPWWASTYRQWSTAASRIRGRESGTAEATPRLPLLWSGRCVPGRDR